MGSGEMKILFDDLPRHPIQQSFLVFPIWDSLRPELAWQAIRERQARYEIDHGQKPEGNDA